MNTFTIARKELSSYFRSPIAYGVMSFFAVITGFFFWLFTQSFLRQSLQATMMGQSVPLSVNEWVIRGFLNNMSVVGLFIIPMITMRLFAEEKRTGTIELLVTSPLRDFEIILGKWLAAMILYLTILAISMLNILILFAYGNPDWRPIAIGYLGLILQGGCLMAIGTFISATTRNQIVAAVGTFGVCLLLWVMDSVSQFDSSRLFTVISYLSVTSHLESFMRGVLDSKDAVYYLSVIVFGLFMTSRAMESIRWRA
jgi:ABC-2 type transport system permease protein